MDKFPGEPTVARGWVFTYLVVVAAALVGVFLLSNATVLASLPHAVQNVLMMLGMFFIFAAICIAVSAPVLIMASQRDKRLALRFPQAVVFGFAAQSHSKAFFRSRERLDGLPTERIRPTYYTAMITSAGIELWYGWREYRMIFAIPAASIASIEMDHRTETGRTNNGLLFTFNDGTPPLFTGVHGGAFGGTVVIKKAPLTKIHQRIIGTLTPTP